MDQIADQSLRDREARTARDSSPKTYLNWRGSLPTLDPPTKEAAPFYDRTHLMRWRRWLGARGASPAA
jgi:hypothetical protein